MPASDDSDCYASDEDSSVCDEHEHPYPYHLPRKRPRLSPASPPPRRSLRYLKRLSPTPPTPDCPAFATLRCGTTEADLAMVRANSLGSPASERKVAIESDLEMIQVGGGVAAGPRGDGTTAGSRVAREKMQTKTKNNLWNKELTAPMLEIFSMQAGPRPMATRKIKRIQLSRSMEEYMIIIRYRQKSNKSMNSSTPFERRKWERVEMEGVRDLERVCQFETGVDRITEGGK